VLARIIINTINFIIAIAVATAHYGALCADRGRPDFPSSVMVARADVRESRPSTFGDSTHNNFYDVPARAGELQGRDPDSDFFGSVSNHDAAATGARPPESGRGVAVAAAAPPSHARVQGQVAPRPFGEFQEEELQHEGDVEDEEHLPESGRGVAAAAAAPPSHARAQGQDAPRLFGEVLEEELQPG